MASFGFMVIRGLFALAGEVAPRLAGRVAFELLSRTPPPGRLSKREREALAHSAGVMEEARRHRLRLPGGCVVAHDFAPEGGSRRAPAALVLHGWGSRAAHMATVIDELRRAGFRVIALDLPGHGESAGRSLNMASAVRAVQMADQWFGPFAAIVGHSFGGAVAANAVVGSIAGVPPVGVGRLVLVSAPSSMPALFSDFGAFLDLGPRAQTALAERVRELTGRPLEEFVVADQLAARRVPALVVHAPDDKEVPAREAESLVRAGTHARLRWVPGLGHRRILADPGVARTIAGFLTEPGGAAPAGAGDQPLCFGS